ncbi:hypothetical protein GCM10010840_28120 [Deinococcus aerolatus]|uniref:Uncharacterized protein n=1 Tax=Deinococcus aerolatus TaxID=522487 RepID=A0ABQ2GDP9_9DEIO|nr:hypothetical protein [Deinococcus aerolatus]GGL88492.1 hypothetical protein GCM10010840_28120 [Deinococcus aerolatus]
MSPLKTAVRRLSVAVLTLGLLGVSGEAAPAETLGTQLTAMSATGLKLSECQTRMQTLGTMLSKAGYVSRRAHLGADAVMTALWYHPQRHTTVVAFSGWQASDNAFSAAEIAGQVGWNEFLPLP